MKKTYAYIAAVLVLFSMAENGSADTWRVFTNGNDIVDMASHEHWLWCATTGGVVRWDTRDMTYRKFTTLDGLPTNGINCIDVGPDGDVWCGTDYGAVRYDGVKWETFTVEDGLYNDYVNDVAIGSDGVVWCSTEDGGISRFNGEKWDVMTWPDVLPLRWITEIAVAPGGELWFGMHNVYKYDGESFELMSGSLGEDQMRTMAIGPDGDVWMAMSRHLHYYDGYTWKTFFQEENPRSIAHSEIIIGPDNIAWFVQGSTLWKYDDGFKEFTQLPMDNAASITVDIDGNVWIGCSMTTYYGRGAIIKVNENENTMHQLPDVISNYIFSASLGPGSSVFLSGIHGVVKIENGETSTFYFPDNYGTPIRARCTTYDIHGNLWFGVGGGLLSFNEFDNSYGYLSYEDYKGGQVIDKVVADHSGNIWFSSWSDVMTTYRGYGVVKWDGNEVKTYTIDDGLFGNWIQDLTVDSQGNIWAAGKTESEISLYKPTNAGTGESMVTGGISRFDGSTWTSWTPDDGLVHYDLLSLAVEPDGDIWCGTTNGVSHFDGENFTNFTTADGLANDHVNSVAVDAEGLVWFGTNDGASVFDGANWKTYTTADGLPDNVVNMIVIDHDDNVYFCTDHGFSVLERSPVHVDLHAIRPVDIRITGNAPNPFNPSTTIRFTLPGDQHVDLSVYNSVGQRIRTLASEWIAVGEHSVAWDGRDESGRAVSSGVFIAGLRAGGRLATHRMTLVR